MHGVGTATSAITFVNALPTGIGAAAGVDLKVRVEVTIDRDASGGRSITIRPGSSDTPVVRTTLRESLEQAGLAERRGVEVSIDSEIPPAAGLKSSSAVASAVARAVDDAVGLSPAPEEVARRTAGASRRAGVSATGAFDDALAGLTGGVVVTDNSSDRILRIHPLPPHLGVVLWIPPGRHPPSPGEAARFRAPDPRAQRAVDSALGGQLWEAMRANTELVESLMGYDYAELRDRLSLHGALAAGTSGLGPALAVIGPSEQLSRLAQELPASSGERRITSFTSHPSAKEGT